MHNCLDLKFSLSCCIADKSGSVCFSDKGSKPFVCLQSKRWARLVIIPSDGVFRCANMASYGSVLLARAVLINVLAVFTALSAIPLDCGKCGLVVTWLNIHCCENSANSADVNCGPLSVITMSGIP